MALLDFPEVLRVHGVMAKGYGIICKFPMTDPELSLSAKAVYAMICSMAGNDKSTFPSRDKITGYLKIGKDKSTAAMKELTTQGYLSVGKRILPTGQYTSNEYTIEYNPKKFVEEKYESSGGSLTSSFSYSGIMKAGYGMLPRLLIMDTRLSYQAKVIYAYLASFSGAGSVAFPKTSLIQYHLGISQSTYQRHMHQLIETNYISVVQRHIDGLLAANNYTLELHPDATAVKNPQERRKMKTVINQIRQSKDTVQICQTKDMDQVGHSEDMDQIYQSRDMAEESDPLKSKDIPQYQVRQNQDMVFQDTDNQDVVNQDMEDQVVDSGDITKNSFPINSFSNISPSINSAEHWTDGMSREGIIEFIEVENQPYTLSKDYNLHISDSKIRYIIETIAEFILSGRNLRIRGITHERAEVIDRLLNLAVWHYDYVDRKISKIPREIKNLREYYLVCLYSAEEDMNAETERELAQAGY